VRRAFSFIFSNLVGRSEAAARVRAAAWQSIFTHDMRRYRRSLYSRMGDLPTLITGASGTGKELVARAIGLSRYVPFDAEQRRFPVNFAEVFLPLNLSALSPTLIESELFGHRKGAFTGALEDHAGWLARCGQHGCVFLDEIGELDPKLQVKLLRVLQSRTFQRLGDSQERHFEGKVIAATNRDLEAEIDAGSFRLDLFYRLCADRITAPTLAEQLREHPEDLPNMVRFVASKVAGEAEAAALSEEVVSWIDRRLGRDYEWPGNFRELEQCVRNILVRRAYEPGRAPRQGAASALAGELERGQLSAEELLNRYCAVVYAQTGSYVETARRLDLDRRTVKRRVEEAGP